MADLENEIGAIAQSSGMDVGVAVIDLESNGYAGHASSERMVCASMIKMIIAEAFLKQVHDGSFSLDDSYTLKAEDIVAGTGTLGGLGPGAQVTYREILDRMITVSDNTAANVLIDALGMDAINAEAQRLGLSATQLNRRMMDSEAISAGIENYTSADDLATLFKMIYSGTFVDAESSRIMLDSLSRQQDHGGIIDGLPAGAMFAHKTGALPSARHDGGIAQGEHPAVIVVLCGGAGFNEQGAFQTMAAVGSAAYAHIG